MSIDVFSENPVFSTQAMMNNNGEMSNARYVMKRKSNNGVRETGGKR